jgi:hypothetical protein
MLGRRWRSLGEFAADELPRPEAPLRAGEHVGGSNRRLAQFLGWHAEGRIEVEARHPPSRCSPTRQMGPVKFGQYARVDFHTNELMRSDQSHFSGTKVRFTDPPAAERSRLFTELARVTVDPGRLTVPQAVAAILARHPNAPNITRLFDPDASNLAKADFDRTLRREWQIARERTKK